MRGGSGTVSGAEQADRNTVRIVVLGSSTAAGIGPSDLTSAWVNRYRADLQALNPGHEMINLAVGGYTTYEIMPDGYRPPPGRPTPDASHNITKAISLGADAILISTPSNDIASGYTPTEQQSNYETILAHAEAAEIPVWISTTQPRNLDDAGRLQLVSLRDWTFDRFADRAWDCWTGLADGDGCILPQYDSGDGVHLNDAAHMILHQRVFEKTQAILDAIKNGITNPGPSYPTQPRNMTIR